MRPGSAIDAFLASRVSMPTTRPTHGDKPGTGTADIPAPIRTRAFFSARVAEANILDGLRRISDGYTRGEMGREEAVTRLREFIGAQRDGSGKYDLNDASLKQLASHSRLNLILRTNERIARAVGEYHRMNDPEIRELYPYVIYHCGPNARESHRILEGMVFSKDDPFLLKHWPPWDFNCNCYLEECTRKRAERIGIQPATPEDQAAPQNDSGFEFDPRYAFMGPYELGRGLSVASRQYVLQKAEEAVAAGNLPGCGLVCAPMAQGIPQVPVAGLDQVRSAFQAMAEPARQTLREAGLDADKLPGYKAVNQAVKSSEGTYREPPVTVRNAFPAGKIQVGTLTPRAALFTGVPKDKPVTLDAGDEHNGLTHLWRDHKDVFCAPEKAARILSETLGDPNCRVVVSLARAVQNKTPLCIRKIVLHNADTKAYCVLNETDGELRLVSWHCEEDAYGNKMWPVK